MEHRSSLAEKLKTPGAISGEYGFISPEIGRARTPGSILAGVGRHRFSDLARGMWQNRIGLFPSVYRIAAFIIAVVQVYFSPWTHYLAVPVSALLAATGVYTIFRVLHPLHWQQRGVLAYCLLGGDMAVCSFLVTVTGGLYSPFLLYTLAPVLSAAVFLDIKVTFSIAALFGAEAILNHVYNSIYFTGLSLSGLNSFWIYFVAVSITAAVPYIVNINVRQRMEAESILLERKRLSREIHDGVAQVLAGVRWQAQLVRRHLAERGIDMGEVSELITQVTRGEQDARESMGLLRSNTGEGAFLLFLRDYLEHLSQVTGITYRLNVEVDRLHLEPVVELQLLRICQEAMTNIRKHSRAHNVQATVKLGNGNLSVSIDDDGCGFDAQGNGIDGLPTPGRGLDIMRERTESIGGKLWVVSLPGQGTKIQIEVPYGPRGRWPWLAR